MVKRDRRLRRRRPAQRWGRWGKIRYEGRFEGWRRIRDLSNLGAEGDGGEERFCRDGIGAARYFNPKRGSANLFCRRPFWGGGGSEGGGGWLGATRPSDTRDHHDTTLVRLHLRMQTNLLSFANESVCITMPVFSLQIIVIRNEIL